MAHVKSSHSIGSSMEKASARDGSMSSKVTTQPIRKGPAYVKSNFNTMSLGNPFTGRKARASGGQTR